jgi:hypothetical protein
MVKYTLLTSPLDGVGGQRHDTAFLTPRKRPGTRCIGGWVGPRAALDTCGKSRPPLGFDPRNLQPVASRYPGPQFYQTELQNSIIPGAKIIIGIESGRDYVKSGVLSVSVS